MRCSPYRDCRDKVTDFVDLRASKACASVPALERLPPSATWTILRYCVNERLNYLAQVTDFPLVQETRPSPAWTGLSTTPSYAQGEPPDDPLTHLTTLTLRSLPTNWVVWAFGAIVDWQGRQRAYADGPSFMSLRSDSHRSYWRVPWRITGHQSSFGSRSRVCFGPRRRGTRTNAQCRGHVSGLLHGNRGILPTIRLY